MTVPFDCIWQAKRFLRMWGHGGVEIGSYWKMPIETVRAELGEAKVQSALEDVIHMTMKEAIEFALADGLC